MELKNGRFFSIKPNNSLFRNFPQLCNAQTVGSNFELGKHPFNNNPTDGSLQNELKEIISFIFFSPMEAAQQNISIIFKVFNMTDEHFVDIQSILWRNQDHAKSSECEDFVIPQTN